MAVETVDLNLDTQGIPFEGLPTISQQYTGIPIRAFLVTASQTVALTTGGDNLLLRARFALPEAGAFTLVDLGAATERFGTNFPTVTGLRILQAGRWAGQWIACNSWGLVTGETGNTERIWMPERLPTFPIRGHGGTDYDIEWWATSDTAITAANNFSVHFFARFLEYDQIQFDGYQVNTPVITAH